MIHYDFSLLTAPPKDKGGSGQEWLDARRGRITASKRAHMILTSRKHTLNTMMDQMAEELTVSAEDGYSGRHTQHGHDFEPQALLEYEMMRLSSGDIVGSPGMVIHPEFDIASSSPDFFEGSDITGQIKCPSKEKNHNLIVHWGMRRAEAKYYTQVQFESFTSGRDRIMFVSYHPDVAPTNQVYIEEVKKDNEMHDQFYAKLTEISWMLVNDERYAEEKNELGVDSIPLIF